MAAEEFADFYDRMDFDGWSDLDIAEASWNAAKAAEALKPSHNKQSTKLCRSCIKLWSCVAAGETIETCDCYEAMA